MESLSKQELISTITKQADQIKRYEARLRDVVAAYKGLIKEKDALEISLKALSKGESSNDEGSKDSVAALTQSLATLTAEKSRMEEAFQADKKVTREKYENMLSAMREESKTLAQQHQIEIGNLKAKLAYEIQEREKERANHTAMLKELNMKLTSERKIKEKVEDKVTHSTEEQEPASHAELESRVRELNASLEAAQRRLQRAEARAHDTPALLRRLQNKLALVEHSHSIALREEQIKVKRAEESARKTCARQEERVALLEGKLAELSQTIGEYDLRRRKDQQTIQQLKESLNGSILDKVASRRDETPTRSETDNEKLADSEYLRTLIDRIHILKKELIAENEKMGGPIDMATVFYTDCYVDPHEGCRLEALKLKSELDVVKGEVSKGSGDGDGGEVEALREEVAMLREQGETYRLVLEEERREREEAVRACEEKLLSEKERYEEALSDMRRKLHLLEQQLRSQREKCAQLLRENDAQMTARRNKEVQPPPQQTATLPGALTDAPAHMLHYAHELARRDLDISQLRREKHTLEGQYRDCQREATIEKERFKEVIRTLKEEIDRLRRSQSREGANLEYLKNVVLAYLLGGQGGGGGGRTHMINAIAAVLHFTAAERAAVISAL